MSSIISTSSVNVRKSGPIQRQRVRVWDCQLSIQSHCHFVCQKRRNFGVWKPNNPRPKVLSTEALHICLWQRNITSKFRFCPGYFTFHLPRLSTLSTVVQSNSATACLSPRLSIIHNLTGIRRITSKFRFCSGYFTGYFTFQLHPPWAHWANFDTLVHSTASDFRWRRSFRYIQMIWRQFGGRCMLSVNL